MRALPRVRTRSAHPRNEAGSGAGRNRAVRISPRRLAELARRLIGRERGAALGAAVEVRPGPGLALRDIFPNGIRAPTHALTMIVYRSMTVVVLQTGHSPRNRGPRTRPGTGPW